MEPVQLSVFSEAIYPSCPFKDPAWLGLAFDREKYDHTRMPRDVLHAFLSIAAESSSSRASVHGLGLNFSDSAGGEGSVEMELTPDEYLRMVFDDRWYSPEYRIAEVTGAWGIWLHWEWSILGGPREMMINIFAALGGEARVWARVEREFSLSEPPVDPTLKLYLQSLHGQRASAASQESPPK
jgi:hypothetical protein